MSEIYAYENGKIICCKPVKECNKECSCYDNNGDCICGAKYYNEIKELCKDPTIDYIKAEEDHIKCTKYTGYFQLSDGSGVFILPKVDKKNPEEGMQILINLLENANEINNVKIGSDTSTRFENKIKFIEILTDMFCSYMDKLFKKGIKKFYSPEEDNLPYLKGKIKFSEHIKRNITSKEKFYCEYDEFTENIPENRILVSACNYLIKTINGLTNGNEKQQKKRDEYKNRLKRYIKEFGDIEESKNLEKDFAKIQPNRIYEHYDKPLLFAEVFLYNKNFWIKRGRKKFPAIMFNLEKLYEQYIESMLDYYKSKYNFDFNSQDCKNYLLTEKYPDEKPDIFNTQMDFILWHKDDDENKNKSKWLIFDAKYKLIDLSKGLKNYGEGERFNQTGISPNDLYQLFAYSEIIKKANKKNDRDVKVDVALLYPKTDKFKENESCYYFNGTKITFIPIDMTGENEEDKFNKNEFLGKFLEEYFK